MHGEGVSRRFIIVFDKGMEFENKQENLERMYRMNARFDATIQKIPLILSKVIRNEESLDFSRKACRKS
jgi:hypothetical protein